MTDRVDDRNPLPGAWWGKVGAPLPDWRAAPPDDDDDDDDDLLAETPADVVEALGFDPLDEGDGEAEDDLAFDPPVSEAQRRAMWAAAEGRSTLGIPKSVGKKFVGAAHDAAARGAGVIFMTPGGYVLWLKRGGESDHSGAWCFPGGTIEAGETPEAAARREAHEEIGYVPEGAEFNLLHRGTSEDDVDFSTFICRVPGQFIASLDGDHSAWAWARMEDPPEPIHPAIAELLASGWSVTPRTAADDFKETDHPRDHGGR